MNSSPAAVRAFAAELAGRGVVAGLRPLQALLAIPSLLFVAALTAMLLRPPDNNLFPYDRVAFVLLVLTVIGRAMVLRQSLRLFTPATWPIAGLLALGLASALSQPYEAESWSLLAAKFIVPYTLFHLAGLVFEDEAQQRWFEAFALVALAYLSFTAIAFLAGAKSLIWPGFILDESVGYHADRARGPFLQAVANGVSLNLLGLLALHSFRRGRLRGPAAVALLASLPVAILATMTRAVWLSFTGSVGTLLFHSPNQLLRRVCLGLAVVGIAGLLLALSFADLRGVLADRLEERSPVEFREAVYQAGWAAFLERPITGWGMNQMPTELARQISGYHGQEFYPHNTYLELLVEHGIVGLALYVWLTVEMFRLGRGRIVPEIDSDGFLGGQFRALWPILLAVYLVNGVFVVMNYQFVNGLLFTLAGMLAAQKRRAEEIERRRLGAEGRDTA